MDLRDIPYGVAFRLKTASGLPGEERTFSNYIMQSDKMISTDSSKDEVRLLYEENGVETVGTFVLSSMRYLYLDQRNGTGITHSVMQAAIDNSLKDALLKKDVVKGFPSGDDTNPPSAKAVSDLKAAIDSALSGKADASGVSAALAGKADASGVLAALDEKAYVTDVADALLSKADQVYVDTALENKADKADLVAQVQVDWDETNPASAAYIKNKPAMPAAASSGSLAVAVIDNLISTDADKALSANQGKLLNDALAEKPNVIIRPLSNFSAPPHGVGKIGDVVLFNPVSAYGLFPGILTKVFNGVPSHAYFNSDIWAGTLWINTSMYTGYLKAGENALTESSTWKKINT